MTKPTAITIGSTAAYSLGVDLGREPKDVDIFTDDHNIEGDNYWHPDFHSIWEPGTRRTATLDELTTIKYSHIFWDLSNNSWSKHMSDLMKLKEHGGQVIEGMFNVLYHVWEEKHGKKVVDLNMDRKSFFDNGVPRIFVHDSIHESVSYPSRPIYEECLKDGNEVLMDMKKVWAMPLDKQIEMFREEIYVIALERKLIPNDYRGSPGAAYQWALRRTITSLTKGRSARFIVDNFQEFRRPAKDFLENHRRGSHCLKKFESVDMRD